MSQKNGWISTRMSPVEAFSIMVDGDPGAVSALMQIASSKDVSLSDLITLDSMGLYGKKLCLFWKKCCRKSSKKFKETIEAFRSGKITQDDIHAMLSKKHIKPFI